MTGINPALKNRKKIWAPKALYRAGIKRNRKNEGDDARSHKADKSCVIPIKRKKKC